MTIAGMSPVNSGPNGGVERLRESGKKKRNLGVKKKIRNGGGTISKILGAVEKILCSFK